MKEIRLKFTLPKPCPCCGERPQILENDWGWLYCECKHCGRKTKIRDSHTLAVRLWNAGKTYKV